MSAQKPIPVRLSEDLISRLDRASERLGTNRAALIRFLTKQYLDAMDSAGDDFRPHDMVRLMDSLDGRKNSDTTPAPAAQPVSYEDVVRPKKTKPKSTP